MGCIAPTSEHMFRFSDALQGSRSLHDATEGTAMADESYMAEGAGRDLAKKFEMQAYDLRSFLKEFQSKTGEEAITDGFGILTESKEVNDAYIGYSDGAVQAIKFIHEYLDLIADSLRKVNENTEVTDEGMAALFGNGKGGS